MKIFKNYIEQIVHSTPQVKSRSKMIKLNIFLNNPKPYYTKLKLIHNIISINYVKKTSGFYERKEKNGVNFKEGKE